MSDGPADMVRLRACVTRSYQHLLYRTDTIKQSAIRPAGPRAEVLLLQSVRLVPPTHATPGTLVFSARTLMAQRSARHYRIAHINYTVHMSTVEPARIDSDPFRTSAAISALGGKNSPPGRIEMQRGMCDILARLLQSSDLRPVHDTQLEHETDHHNGTMICMTHKTALSKTPINSANRSATCRMRIITLSKGMP